MLISIKIVWKPLNMLGKYVNPDGSSSLPQAPLHNRQEMRLPAETETLCVVLQVEMLESLELVLLGEWTCSWQVSREGFFKCCHEFISHKFAWHVPQTGFNMWPGTVAGGVWALQSTAALRLSRAARGTRRSKTRAHVLRHWWVFYWDRGWTGVLNTACSKCFQSATGAGCSPPVAWAAMCFDCSNNINRHSFCLKVPVALLPKVCFPVTFFHLCFWNKGRHSTLF